MLDPVLEIRGGSHKSISSSTEVICLNFPIPDHVTVTSLQLVNEIADSFRFVIRPEGQQRTIGQ